MPLLYPWALLAFQFGVVASKIYHWINQLMTFLPSALKTILHYESQIVGRKFSGHPSLVFAYAAATVCWVFNKRSYLPAVASSQKQQQWFWRALGLSWRIFFREASNIWGWGIYLITNVFWGKLCLPIQYISIRSSSLKSRQTRNNYKSRFIVFN